MIGQNAIVSTVSKVDGAVVASGELMFAAVKNA
jgi:hypothetical protein